MARIYEDFAPESEWIHGENMDTLIIHLPPGFKKEHLKAQSDDHGNLKVMGARRLDLKRWARFQKHFLVPDDCDAASIHAKLDDNRLFVTMPKSKGAFHQHEDTNLEEGRDGGEDGRWGKLILYALAIVVGIMVGLGVYVVWGSN